LCGTLPLLLHFSCERRLFADTESFDDSSVTLNIYSFEVVEQLTTFTYQTKQRTLGAVVVAVLFHVLGKVVDTVGKKCNLALRRTSIYFRCTVLAKKLLLFL